jgi:chorismate-pyruvate lyase
MTKGISFNFGDDGKLKLEEQRAKLDCFGGISCEHAEHDDFEIDLDDGSKLPARTYFCRHANKMVTDFMWTECPIGRWMFLKNYHFVKEDQVDVLNCLWGNLTKKE